jgi:hypothetical protein
MEYKSELIDFEKEDMESKKRMLGSDKMNRLELIIKKVEVGQLNWYGRDDVLYLLSIIEQAEKALEFYSNQKHWTTAYYHNEFGKAQVKAMYKPNPWENAEEALQYIRGGK